MSFTVVLDERSGRAQSARVAWPGTKGQGVLRRLQ